MKVATFALGLALFAAACGTIPLGAVSAPGGVAASTTLELGDWRHVTSAAELAQFQTTIASRYAPGAPISAAAADLRRNDFACAANVDPNSPGDPPAQICRKTVTAENCTATWQVHLYDTNNDGRLARTRALYDRRCGNEGLLGGPS